MYSTMESRGETSDLFLLLSSQETGLINSKGSSRTREACASSTRALPGNKDPHPRELYLLLPGTTTNTGSLRLPWATQHPTCEKTAFPRTTQNILRGLHWNIKAGLDWNLGAMLTYRRPRQRNASEQRNTGSQFSSTTFPNLTVFIMEIYLYLSKHNWIPAQLQPRSQNQT